MGSALLERYVDRIAGVLSCYDRVVISGTLSVAARPFADKYRARGQNR